MSKERLLIFGFPGVGLFIGALATEGLPEFSGLIVPLLVVSVLVFLNGIFVAAEFAIIGVRSTRIEQLAEEGNQTASRMLTILDSPYKQDRYIATAQLGITIASLGLGMYAEPQIAQFIEPYIAQIISGEASEVIVHSAGSIITLAFLTYLHVVLGEMIPKSLALSASDNVLLTLARPMSLMQDIFRIPVKILNGISNLMLRLLRIPPATKLDSLLSAEELELIVSESAESGLVTPQEAEYIQNIFDFGERQVHQVMTQRLRVTAIPYSMPIHKILEFVKTSQYSRFPVYEKNLDGIIGILHLKDLACRQIKAKDNSDFDIRVLLRTAPAVPEHYGIDKLLAAFKRQHSHMAIVLDEFGGTAGIVTLQDLIEEVVGEVQDEFHQDVETDIRIDGNVLIVRGDYLLVDLMETVDLGDEEDLPDVETVGGLIMASLDRVPNVGDRITYHGVEFVVLAVDRLAVARARIELLAEEG